MKFILTLIGFLSALMPLFYVNGQSIRQPFTGIALNLPGKIEAENYDIGRQGISYNDSDPLNQGYSYRTDGVDIEPCSEGGYNVGYTVAGEWLEYTVNATLNTSFQLDLRTASTQSGSILRLDIDGIAATKEISLPNTSDWQKWSTTK